MSSQSHILDSFDPRAIHPFTNGSGLVPQPPKPSQYPLPIPSPHRPSAFSATYSRYPSEYKQAFPSSPSSSVSSNSPSSPVFAPEPRRSSHSPTAPTKPIFELFRQDTSSPDLVLKKKTPTTRNVGTQTRTTSQQS